MRIDSDRILRDIEAIGAITETPGGCSRPTFTAAWRAARDYVIDEAGRAGCAVRVDAFGNVHMRPSGVPWESRCWLTGSHVDTVPNGGKFDGVVGVVVGLEILRAAHEAGRTLPMELCMFAEEEGTTFGLGMLGSRAWAGTLSVEQLSRAMNGDAASFLQAGAAHGVDPSHMPADRLDGSRYCGMIEVHVEQGPAMWERGIPVALVTAVNGRRQLMCTIRGVANHAGSTPMEYRFDALAAAGACIVELERLPREFEQAVCTVGRIEARPNAVNVIADEVMFTIDFRSRSERTLADGAARMKSSLGTICDRRGVKLELREYEHLPPVRFDARVCDRIRAAAGQVGLTALAETTSGALHDAVILAPFVPSAMVFVASKDGVSHNPAEFSRAEDITLAARIVGQAVSEVI